MPLARPFRVRSVVEASLPETVVQSVQEKSARLARARYS